MSWYLSTPRFGAWQSEATPELPVNWATAPLRKIEMPYDREDRDVECTKNVY